MPIHVPLFIIYLVKIISVTSGETEFESELVNLVDRVIEDQFKQFRCVTFVLDEGIEMEFGQRLPVINIRLPAEGEVLKESFEQGCGGYIVRVQNKSEVMGLLMDTKRRTSGFRYNNQRYLFLPVDETDSDLEPVRDPRLFFMPNWVLVVPESDLLSAITHTVFDHHKHELLGIDHEVLDVWTPGRGFDFGNDLYPDKVSDVKGKKLVFALLNYSPFGLVTKEGNKTLFDGFETRIAAEFVEFVNGTWEGLDHPQDLWGIIYPNGSGTGIVGSVMSHKADFGYSAMYQWFCDDFDCTYPVYESGVTCLVPRPSLVSGWLTIVLPFETDTWIALIVVYIISSSFVWILLLAMQFIKGVNIKEEIGWAMSDSFFTIFRLQLEQIPVIPRSKQSLAVYVRITVYYYFFVAAFWQGGIASILTVPRFEKPINTALDLIERWPKIKWGADSDAWVNSLRASSEPTSMQIVQKFVTHDYATLDKKVKTRDFAFFVEELPHGHFGLGDFITEESMKYLKIMESNIYTAFGVFILPRSSPYAEKFDHTVLRLFDSGVIHKMEDQVSLDRINNRLQNMVKSSNVKDVTTIILAVRHIQGAIIIYFAGMTLATFAFFIEYYVLKPNQSTRPRLMAL